MAAGLPIITTDRGGNSEVINHRMNGLIIKEYDQTNAFAEAISQLLADSTGAVSLGKYGRQYAEKNFTFQHTAEKLETIYVNAQKFG